MSNISETLRIQFASHLLSIQKIRLLFHGQTYLGFANEQETYFTYFTLVFMLLPRTLKLICLLISITILILGNYDIINIYLIFYNSTRILHQLYFNTEHYLLEASKENKQTIKGYCICT